MSKQALSVGGALEDLIDWTGRNGGSIEDLISEKFNCDTAEVEGADIWIEGPMTGHWLTPTELQEFVEWVDGHHD